METTAGTHAYELSAQPERSLSQRVLVDLFALARSEGELKLIEAELRASAGVRAGLSFGLASIFASVASAGIGAAFVAGLSRVVPLWTAALGAAVVFAVPALALAGRGREASRARERADGQSRSERCRGASPGRAGGSRANDGRSDGESIQPVARSRRGADRNGLDGCGTLSSGARRALKA